MLFRNKLQFTGTSPRYLYCVVGDLLWKMLFRQRKLNTHIICGNCGSI
jgi:hypothetical protein